ncbi:transmembrane protease serine 4 [Pelobates cultripes]|uniref:Transmembrane protease serine 4 n=1 Tax=Pelobates cultripes TaxID=61616 RepID=A0AAD1T9B2_PELCU|nr:transmembrane protease serine 4 [Pelobates cultripes]
MSAEVEEADAVSPLNRSSAPIGETPNAPLPARATEPAAPAHRITAPNTRPGVPIRAPRAANGALRPPASRNAGPTRTPGPVRGVPRPTSSGTLNVIYKRGKISVLRRYCVPITTTVLVLASLVVIAILIKVVLDNYYFFCLKSFKFVSLDKLCDGIQDCTGGEDEIRCVKHVGINSTPIVRFSEQFSALQVQVRSTQTWSWVCSDNFDNSKAKAVCAQIGYSSTPVFSSVTIASLSNPSAFGFSNVQVLSNELQVIPTLGGRCPSGSIISLRCAACGPIHKQERIIGGSDTTIEIWPWQLSLQYMGQHVCGGSVLNQYWILTAAHCFKGQEQVDRWRIQVGLTKLSFLFGLQVDRIFVHNLYNYDQKPNDIALMKLKSDLRFSASIQPICLPGFDISLLPATVLWVTGWGDTQEGGNLATVLQQVSIQVISYDTCNNEYGQILPSMLCAGRVSGGLDTCQGDSGGPLVSLEDRWEQVGIVSWGDGCARPGRVGVYTKVPSFLDWIHAIMKQES